jgi:hypothetical protein
MSPVLPRVKSIALLWAETSRLNITTYGLSADTTEYDKVLENTCTCHRSNNTHLVPTAH